MKIKFHYSLLIIFSVFLFAGLHREFLLFFIIILAHECGHLLVCLLFHQKLNNINITLVGGALDVNLQKLTPFQEICIYSAGIIVNTIILLLSAYIKNPYYQNLIYNYNFLLILFNLLPIYPLDGFRIIEVVFGIIKNPFKEQKIITFISITCLIGLSVYVYSINSLAFWVIDIYLIFQNINMSSKKYDMALKKIIRRYRYN